MLYPSVLARVPCTRRIFLSPLICPWNLFWLLILWSTHNTLCSDICIQYSYFLTCDISWVLKGCFINSSCEALFYQLEHTFLETTLVTPQNPSKFLSKSCWGNKFVLKELQYFHDIFLSQKITPFSTWSISLKKKRLVLKSNSKLFKLPLCESQI